VKQLSISENRTLPDWTGNRIKKSRYSSRNFSSFFLLL